jgi:hypothetical protein
MEDSPSKLSAGLLGLATLFDFEKKKELVKHAKDLVITKHDFARLVQACEFSDIGYLHRIHQRDIIPEQLRIQKGECGLLLDPTKNQKAATKILQVFRDRRFLVGHIFYTADLVRWHFFYFDQRDLGADPEQVHWRDGSHIHFINHLWPNFTAQGIWDRFLTKDPLVSGSLHIHYRWR